MSSRFLALFLVAAGPASCSTVGTAHEVAPATVNLAGIGDPYFPELGNAGYDVGHYFLDLVYDPETGVLEGEATLTVRATQDLTRFHLDLVGLLVSAVSVDGRPASFRHSGRELEILPEAPIADGADFQVTVAYSGVPTGVTEVSVPVDRIGWVRYDSGVFILSQPSGAASFYPCNDHPRDKATHTFRVTVPDGLTVAANGKLVSSELVGEKRTFVFEAADLMATYLTTINIGELEHVTHTGPGGVPMNHYFPEGKAEDLREMLDTTDEVLEFFVERFGAYPFESFGAVVANEPIPGALETQTLPVYGIGAFRPRVIAHEMAHQWFGNSVSVKSWRDIWLSEGFAMYLETMYSTGDEPDEVLGQYWRMLAARDVPGPGDPGAENLFGPAVYIRGAWVVHALRLSLGDEKFFRGLNVYLERYRDSVASTEDFQRVMEETSGRDLKAVMDRWLGPDPVPDVPELGLTRAES